jgi:hypothetical protein
MGAVGSRRHHSHGLVAVVVGLFNNSYLIPNGYFWSNVCRQILTDEVECYVFVVSASNDDRLALVIFLNGASSRVCFGLRSGGIGSFLRGLRFFGRRLAEK